MTSRLGEHGLTCGEPPMVSLAGSRGCFWPQLCHRYTMEIQQQISSFSATPNWWFTFISLYNPRPPPYKWTNTLGEDMEGLSVSRLMAFWFRQMLYSLDRSSVLCRSPGPYPLNSRSTAPLCFDKPTSRLGQIIHKIDTKQPLMSWFSLHVLRGVWKMWSLMGKPSSAEQEESRDELGVLGEVSQLRVPPYGKVTPCGYL